MANFTQLNLQDRPKDKPGRVTASDPQPHSNFGTSAAVAGSFLVTTLMTLSLLNTGGCSKETKTNDRPRVAAAQPVNVAPTAPLTIEAPKKPLSRKPVHHRPAVAMYSNSDYGVSFLYPRQYGLKQGDKATPEWSGMGPVAMNFVQPGGTSLASVDVPSGSYPNTDFISAFFAVNVNKSITASQCEQFPASDLMDAKKASAMQEVSHPENAAATPTKVKLGGREYSEVEDLIGDSKQADAKYYHTFENGACYEFTLGLQTAAGDDTEDATPVDRAKVFSKLEHILADVRIKPIQSSVITSDPAVSETAAKSSGVAATTPTQSATTSTMMVGPTNKPQ